MNNKTKKAKASKKKGALKETPANAITYKGPISTPEVKEASDSHTCLLCISNALASSAAGVIDTVFSPYSQASSSSNWTSLIACFSEYRILAYKLDYIPVNQYNKAAATSVFPVISVVDRVSASNLVSLSDAAGYASSKDHSLEQRWSREIRMDGVEEALFVNVLSAPATGAQFYLKIFSNGLTATTTYGQYLAYILVQFRGLR